ncbi:hypothetical protein BGZ57DRAFT_940407 [Hyaloscypha finlandica]|nr:hypothetical protein BGZ57DRAFT_940407 [Hyaloscypha finlandica]
MSRKPLDPEAGRPPEAWRDGYPAVAAWMAKDPDSESFVYRKFDKLSARNLLNLQSELIDLESRQEKFDEESRNSNDQVLKQSNRKWETFAKNAVVREQERQRMELNKEIRAKLREYHETLLLQSQIANLDRPSNRVLSAFHSWFTVLGGRAKDVLDDRPDLVRRAEDGQGTTGHYLEKHVVWAVAIISTIIAAILLIGAIVGLYIVQKTEWRLIMLSCFTALFAISVGLLTSARRAEIFGSTAAYAAVLVVFVSSNLVTLPPGG